MGVVVVDRSGTGSPATEAPAVKATAVEEEAEIEEIVRREEENVAPQMHSCCKEMRQRVGVL
jgi:hypothetical protein